MKVLELIFWLIVVYMLIGLGDYFWNRLIQAFEELNIAHKELKEAERKLKEVLNV